MRDKSAQPQPQLGAELSTFPATDPAQVYEQAQATGSLPQLETLTCRCHACPRLVAWREQVAAARRPAYVGQQYWARPVPGWGDEQAPLVLLGLAPAAQGGNRTGRLFTGDRSGQFLFASLHRLGLAALPTSLHADDGQRLFGVRLVAALRCAPPQNQPTVVERDTCAPWLQAELRLLQPRMRVVLALGAFAWKSALSALAELGYARPRPVPPFHHGAEVQLLSPEPDEAGLTELPYLATASPRSLQPVTLLASYHPSQQNTFTKVLTPEMLDAVLQRAKQLAALG